MTGEPLGADDAAEWAKLMASAQAVDETGEYPSAEELAEDLADPMVDRERGTLAIRHGADLIGYALLRCSPTADVKHSVRFEGAVRPDHRNTGVGRRIVQWAITSAPVVHRDRYPGMPLELTADANGRNPAAHRLLSSAGFTPARWFFTMRRDLSGAVRAAEPIDGVRITVFDFAHDEATRLLRNETFDGHWGSTPQTEQTWRQWFTGSRAFRPDLTFLAFDQHSGELVGFLLTKHYESDTEATGVAEAFVNNVGVRRAWRKRGIAAALIDTTLAEARRQGFARAALDVDSANPTGALGLYESRGFEVASRFTNYLRRVDL